MTSSREGGDAGAQDRPFLRVVKGNPSDEEIAALVAVLQASAAAADSAPRGQPVSEWSAPHRLLGTMVAPGPGAWRASSLPR